MKHFKVVVEHHEDGYVAYPVGLNGVIVGQGDTLDDAVADVRTAIQFHIETFGAASLGDTADDVVLTDVTVAA